MIQNKRDLGGLKTADGRRIRPGCLVRSAHLYHPDLVARFKAAVLE